jgi:transcription elongation GreA/GreB family factor
MADDIQTHLTLDAYDRLDAEFRELVDVARPEISRKIQEAREEGDLKENGGYHAAREEQGRIEARISKLEKLLKSAILTNGKDFNFLEDLRKYRLEAIELCKEPLFFAAVLDYLNFEEESESTLAAHNRDEDADPEADDDENDQVVLDKNRFNQIHIRHSAAENNLRRIVDSSSLNESDLEFFKAQLDRSVFALKEASRLNSNFVAFALIPEIKESLLKFERVASDETIHEVNEDTFQITKVIFKKIIEVLFPNGNDSSVKPEGEGLLSLSVEKSLEKLNGDGNLDSEFESLSSKRDSLTVKISRLIATRAIILSQGRVSGDSSLEMLDSDLGAITQQIRVIDEKISALSTRARITDNDSQSTPSHVSMGMVITIELNEKKMEFLLGSAEMAENTDMSVYSPDSPMGIAIMGAKIGESVSYTAPNGKTLTVNIVSVKHFEG